MEKKVRKSYYGDTVEQYYKTCNKRSTTKEVIIYMATTEDNQDAQVADRNVSKLSGNLRKPIA